MWGMEIGKRLAEKRMRNTADLRKDIRLTLEWHLRYIIIILLEGKHNNSNSGSPPQNTLNGVLVARRPVYPVRSRGGECYKACIG